MPTTIRVAIIGGGIMGCTLANGLLRHSNIDWHVFEGKPTFKERGATVGFRANATKALAAIGLDPDGMYKRSGAVISDKSHDLVAYGENKGKTIIELPGGHINIVRTRWLRELLEPLPEERLHSAKKLGSIELPSIKHEAVTQGPYKLHFQDGSTHIADLVVGCDGIHSKVRGLILHEYPDQVAPHFGGYWDARGNTTPQEAARRFGNDLFDPLRSTEVALTGNGAFMLFCPSEDSSEYAVIVSAVASQDFDRSSWKAKLSRGFLNQAYHDWEPKFRDAVIDCIVDKEDNKCTVFAQWMTPPTPIYYREPGLCIAGDAAHSMLPFMGCGASMAIEDAATLSILLGSCETVGDVTPALKAFDYTRRERNEELVKTSQQAAKLMTGGMGLDVDRVANMNPSKWWMMLSRPMSIRTFKMPFGSFNNFEYPLRYWNYMIFFVIAISENFRTSVTIRSMGSIKVEAAHAYDSKRGWNGNYLLRPRSRSAAIEWRCLNLF